jgi:hypothetical protein
MNNDDVAEAWRMFVGDDKVAPKAERPEDQETVDRWMVPGKGDGIREEAQELRRRGEPRRES